MMSALHMYLAFHKGGATFSLATSASTKGAELFFPMAKLIFGLRGAMAHLPPEYAKAWPNAP